MQPVILSEWSCLEQEQDIGPVTQTPADLREISTWTGPLWAVIKGIFERKYYDFSFQLLVYYNKNDGILL